MTAPREVDGIRAYWQTIEEDTNAPDYLREIARESAAVLAAHAEAEAEAERERYREAATWVLNVASGIGKNGGPPEDEEYTAALNALKDALAVDGGAAIGDAETLVAGIVDEWDADEESPRVVARRILAALAAPRATEEAKG